MKEIDRLRWKFMFYNMLIVTAVIGVTFISSALLVKRRSNEEVSTALERAAGQQTDTVAVTMALPVHVPYFSVVVQNDGIVLLQEGAYNSLLNRELLESIALRGMENGSDQGALEDYSLRYLRVSHPSGWLIVFADTSYQKALVDDVLENGIIACCLIWFGFLALSWFFASWAVRPVKEALQQQKQFVADASHELKTPLTIIMANAELLEDKCGKRADEVDKWLDNIKQECLQMRRLVESLLMLARSDLAGKTKVDWRLLDFSDLVTEQLLTFEPVFFQLGKSLSYQLADRVMVKGSPDQLKQAVKILLDNAAKYSDEGSCTEILLESSGRRRVRLWVKSHGNPIPKEQRKAVFRRFYRGDASRSGSGGYGLGLAIAQVIARSHRGSLGLEGEGDKNCFYLKLPVVSHRKGRIYQDVRRLAAKLAQKSRIV